MIDCGGESIRHIVPLCSSFSFFPRFVADCVYCAFVEDMGDTFPP